MNTKYCIAYYHIHSIKFNLYTARKSNPNKNKKLLVSTLMTEAALNRYVARPTLAYISIEKYSYYLSLFSMLLSFNSQV